MPKSYSDMRSRISTFTFLGLWIVGLIFASRNASMVELLGGWQVELLDIDWVNPITVSFLAAYALALVAHAIKLHNLVSDVLRLREKFDVAHILKPMAEQVGVPVADIDDSCWKAQRDNLMYGVFYRYAGYAKPEIDPHLVYSALEAWSWLWVPVELAVVCLVAVALLGTASVQLAVGALSLSMLMTAFALLRWRSLPKYSKSEIREILRDASRKAAVRAEFDSALQC